MRSLSKYLILLLLAMAACSPKLAPQPRPVFTQLKDSSWTKQKLSINVTIDTTSFNLPAQRSERDTPCDSSYLENDFAESHAWINADGTLHHDLSTKDKDVPVPVQKVEKESETEHNNIKEVPVPYPEPYPVEVEVPAKLNRWQQFRMTAGDILLIVAAIYLIIIAVKKFILKR